VRPLATAFLILIMCLHVSVYPGIEPSGPG
jgi:hypothetical protein